MHLLVDADPLMSHVEGETCVTILAINIIATSLNDDVNSILKSALPSSDEAGS